MKTFNCLIFIFFIILLGCIAESTHKDYQVIDSKKSKENMLKSIKDQKQRKLVSQFVDNCGKDDTITITEHEDHFEIVIDHPSRTATSGDSYTGGAEQYFLDKKTGKIKMGWHEHPMKLPDGLIK